jgi:hypothetical protein
MAAEPGHRGARGPFLDTELAATVECRLITTGRTTGQRREIRIWFSSVGDRLFLLAQDRDCAHWFLRAALPVAIDLEQGLG